MDDERAGAATLLAGRYELGSLLGQGGMGTVRDATDRRLGRPVAVKILRADLAEQATARRRFETEAHAAARLTHPNVVMVFDSGEDDGIPFLVMERLPGRTLADELAAGPLSLERVGEVARGILAALAAAHAAGIIHRDIKPGNVLVTDAGDVKVSDFGIAKTVDDVDQTQTAELVATPGYLAPERLAGEPASTRSDLYSVGVLLYEALSGRRPFAGDTPLAVMRAIERGHAEPLTSQRRALPAEVVAVVERAMSLDPRRRFASAIDMAAALEPPAELDATEPIETAPIETAPDSETVPVDLGSRDGATRTLHFPSPPEAGRSPGFAWVRSNLLALALALGVAVVLIVGFLASRQGGGHPATSVPSTTARTTPAKPTTTRLPAPLDDAIRRLEQTVAP